MKQIANCAKKTAKINLLLQWDVEVRVACQGRIILSKNDFAESL